MSVFSFDSLVAYVTLTAMEIVLGFDNIIILTLLVMRAPPQDRDKARKVGIILALLTRLGLLFSLNWVMGLIHPLFTVFEKTFSGRDLILIAGGLFLMAKATIEIHDKLEVDSSETPKDKGRASFISIIIQIMFLDIIFSLDSVITAIGMAQQIQVMILAMITAVIIMLLSSKMIGEFIMRHPTIKILALSFLLLIGAVLFADGTGLHISKGYIYFTMAFAVFIEMLNMNYRKKTVSTQPQQAALK